MLKISSFNKSTQRSAQRAGGLNQQNIVQHVFKIMCRRLLLFFLPSFMLGYLCKCVCSRGHGVDALRGEVSDTPKVPVVIARFCFSRLLLWNIFFSRDLPCLRFTFDICANVRKTTTSNPRSDLQTDSCKATSSPPPLTHASIYFCASWTEFPSSTQRWSKPMGNQLSSQYLLIGIDLLSSRNKPRIDLYRCSVWWPPTSPRLTLEALWAHAVGGLKPMQLNPTSEQPATNTFLTQPTLSKQMKIVNRCQSDGWSPSWQ